MFEDEVISIAELGDIDTIDVNVTGNRLFLANNILTHNSAVDAAELNHSHIAGGLSKVNTVDIYASIILSPTMKASGEIGFTFLKTRSSDGVGKTIFLTWDNNSLRILNPMKDLDVDEDGVIAERVASTKAGKKKKSLQDMLTI